MKTWWVLMLALLSCQPTSALYDKKTTIRASSAEARAGSLSPVSWSVPNWFIDPSNTTGCASDNNNGTSATCGTTGVGPLSTWNELNGGRWQCFGGPASCPMLRQETTVTFLSAQTTNTDHVCPRPSQQNGSSLVLQGNLGTAQQVATGSLASVTSKNRSSGTLLSATLPTGAATGLLIKNTTHLSFAWIHTLVSGNTWNISQPFAPITVPATNFLAPTEVDTWANTDSVVIYNPSAVYIDCLEGTFGNFNNNGNLANGFSIYHLTITSPGDTYLFTPSRFGDNTYLIETSSIRLPSFRVGTEDNWAIMMNDFDPIGISTASTNSRAAQLYLYGGIIGQPNASPGGSATLGAGGFLIDEDTIISGGSGTQFVLQGQLGQLYIDTATIGFVNSSAIPLNDFSIWGPGTLSVDDGGRLKYKSGATGAATSLLVSNLRINRQSASCIGIPSSATLSTTCNTSVTTANLDASLGTTSGCLYAPGGGAFCNY
jgi:hypothetical protein